LGLETPVVHALTNESETLGIFPSFKVNALNFPPEEYVRKDKTQRNWRGLFKNGGTCGL